MENKDKPAYPIDPELAAIGLIEQCQGLTKREMFAMAAMQGMSVNYFDSDLSNEAESINSNINVVIAVAAVSLADELLKELESKPL